MRLYLLQIHKDDDSLGENVFDELYHFENFNELCAEFKNKMDYYAKSYPLKLRKIEEPTLDEGDGEVSGRFTFADSDGFRVLARVTDIHIGD